MNCETIRLKDRFPALGEHGADPFVKIYTCQNSARPAILLCPGGGYNMVSDREAEPVAKHLLSWGYQVCILTYSVGSFAFPTQLREVAATMELLWEDAKKYGIDRERIAIMGFSAGGHLACHYTNAFDCPEVRKVFLHSKPVRASILCYPVITTQQDYCHKGSFERLSGGHAPFEDRFSCEKLVSERTPPTFLWHTAPDKTVPVFNSLLYAQALSQYKIPYSLHIYPYGGHGLSTVEPEINPNLPAGAELAKQWLTDLELWLKEIFE